MENEKCPICLDVIGETNKTITKCNHTFCASCLLTNIRESNKCPVCRTELIKKNSKNLFTSDVQTEILRNTIEELDIDDFIDTLSIEIDQDNYDLLYEICQDIITNTLENTFEYILFHEINNLNNSFYAENELLDMIN